MNVKVLLVEDEDAIAEPLAEGLRREGFDVERAATGSAALAAREPDLVLLDIRLPDVDGLTVCRQLRARSSVPIIMITAKGEEIDKVVGLEMGADDYLTKPFGFRELLARIRAVTRRSSEAHRPSVVKVGELAVDVPARTVTLGERELELTPKEFDLLALLARDHGSRGLEAANPRTGLADDVVRQREDDRRPRRRPASQARRSGLDRDGARSGPPPPRPGVRRQLLATYLALALAVLAALEIPLGITYARNQKTDLENRIRLDALTIATVAEDGLERQVARPARALMSTAAAYAKSPGGRIVVVDGRGISLLDTGSRTGRTFASRPEMASALRGRTSSGTRHSSTLGTDLMYVAVPVASSGKVHGAVRVTYPTSALDRRVRRYWLVLAAIAAVVLAVAAVVGVRLSRTVTAPLADLEDATKAAGEGDLTARAAVGAGPPEIRALSARFNEMVARLEVLVRSQQEFVADASHQLRTPLTALQLRLENLGRDVRPGGAAQLDGALAEVTRLGGLVDGLLSLARADAIEASPVSVDLHDAVRSRFAAWAARAEMTDVTLELDVPAGLRAEATPGSLDQVLDNLLANAFAASPQGGRISVRGLRAERFVELHVADEGPGLTVEQRARAFDRFWRDGPSSGTGLGLAIAHQLVTADGGELELRDAVGGGLDAVVRLPAS